MKIIFLKSTFVIFFLYAGVASAQLTLSDSLVLYLPFNGNAVDSSTIGHTTHVNGPVPASDRFGNSNSAYQFDGVDDNIEIADDPSLDVDYLTLSVWIYVDSYTNDARILSRERSTDPKYLYSLLLSGTDDKYPQFRLTLDGTYLKMTSGTAVPLNTWTHLAATYDGSKMKIYINGVPDTEQTATGLITGTDFPLYMSKSVSYTRFFHGRIDEVYAYNRALTSSEISELYTLGDLPGVPGSLNTSVIFPQHVQLTWQDNASNEDGFVVERNTNRAGFQYLDSLAADSTSYIDSTTLLGNEYIYRLSAFNSGGSSGYSNSDTVDVSEITVRYEIEDNFIILSDVGSNGAVGVGSSPVNSNGQAVKVFDSGDEISFGFTVPNAGTYDLGLWLRCGSAAGPDVFWPDGYEFNIPGIGPIVFVGDTSTITGPESAYGTSYWGLMEAGNIYFDSAGTYELHILALGYYQVVDYLELTYHEPVPANAPKYLYVSALADTSVGLSWVDDSNNEQGFLLERSQSGGAYTLLDSIGVNVTSYTDATVAMGVSYTYRLASFNTAGNSGYGNEKSVTLHLPLDPDLLLDLPFAGGSADRSNYGQTVSEQGGISRTADRFGASDSAYAFDAVDDYLAVDYNPGLDLSELTLGAWVYLNSYKNDQRIITKGLQEGSPNISYAMLVEGTGDKYLHLRIGLTDQLVKYPSKSELPLNTWVYAAATYDGDSARLFINGEVDTAYAAVQGTMLHFSNPVLVGGSLFYERHFDGNIDEVQIYDRALSRAEVRAIYDRQSTQGPQAPSDLVAGLTLPNHVELTWTDNSDNEDGFIIERNENGAGFVWLDSVASDVVSYLDTGTQVGLSYAYRLSSFHQSGNSPYEQFDSIYVYSLRDTVLQKEREALIALYNNNDGDNWSLPAGMEWKVNGEFTDDMSTWGGITLDPDGYVTEIVFLFRYLPGDLPPEIGNLSNLRKMWLWFSQLTSLPPEIGNLSGLDTLLLISNQMFEVPPEIGNLSNLRLLDLHMDGSDSMNLPPEIGNLTGLLDLRIAGGGLTSLPVEIFNLSNL
ncbi:MAG: hypothetical protein MI975_22070, partial [Cytophagales bacterium]|nr:hypothetical protein [Cytophagales bacterium]